MAKEEKIKVKKTKEKKVVEGLAKYNRVSKPMNLLFSVIFIIAALACVIPLVLVIIVSFSHKESIFRNGYSFLPDKWSLQGYISIFESWNAMVTAFAVSLFITVVGTVIGLFLNSTIAYVLSRKSFKLRKLYTMIVFIPMIFYGGLTATYMFMTQVYNLKNNILALILPLAVASFYVIILRTFFTSTVPDELIESGKIDGASQLRIFFQIVLPISLPALATIGLFLSFAYWNDWMNALLYIDDKNLFPLQYVLISIEQNIDFLIRNAAMMGVDAAQMAARIPLDGARMAMVVIAVVPIACSYPFFQRYFISGLTVGAVKG